MRHTRPGVVESSSLLVSLWVSYSVEIGRRSLWSQISRDLPAGLSHSVSCKDENECRVLEQSCLGMIYSLSSRSLVSLWVSYSVEIGQRGLWSQISRDLPAALSHSVSCKDENECRVLEQSCLGMIYSRPSRSLVSLWVSYSVEIGRRGLWSQISRDLPAALSHSVSCKDENECRVLEQSCLGMIYSPSSRSLVSLWVSYSVEIGQRGLWSQISRDLPAALSHSVSCKDENECRVLEQSCLGMIYSPSSRSLVSLWVSYSVEIGRRGLWSQISRDLPAALSHSVSCKDENECRVLEQSCLGMIYSRPSRSLVSLWVSYSVEIGRRGLWSQISRDLPAALSHSVSCKDENECRVLEQSCLGMIYSPSSRSLVSLWVSYSVEIGQRGLWSQISRDLPAALSHSVSCKDENECRVLEQSCLGMIYSPSSRSLVSLWVSYSVEIGRRGLWSQISRDLPAALSHSVSYKDENECRVLEQSCLGMIYSPSSRSLVSLWVSCSVEIGR